MSKAKKYLSNYYGDSGKYLSEHTPFFESADINNDIDFLTKALKLKKKDFILDIACGQGRHVNALSGKRYIVDGVDFSKFLLERGRDEAKKIKGRVPDYFYGNVVDFKLKKKYTKAYWFFSDLANIDMAKAIISISRNLEIGARVLFDVDNIFRILKYLIKSESKDFIFDAKKLELIDGENGLHIKYSFVTEWEKWLNDAGLSVEKIYGDYDLSDYSIHSSRLIIVAKKIA